ncbi:hypothetical protein CERZMDRAFT_91071 [Cercospora zeae-maydis SCOH1-5]|uniref:Uncharacterized protein n=1 Tax=Cercospora zeae-maydis SCOH1-5 TaxID=717836 RepID=A0A6A6FBY6_9PEZI|nr:hypothetical protein CERZMDRAFT_91071 [Cercospora zeae-maydis SCOH1-5]
MARRGCLARVTWKYLSWNPYQQLIHHEGSGYGMKQATLLKLERYEVLVATSRLKWPSLVYLYEAEITKANVMPPKVTSSAYKEAYLEDGSEVILEP